MISTFEEVKEFDWSQIRPNSNILIIGKRCSGKTTLAEKCLMEIDKKEPFKLTNSWGRTTIPQIPTNLQYLEYYSLDLENFYHVHQKSRRGLQDNSLLLFDDNDWAQVSKNHIFQNYIFNGNHMKATLIYTSQSGLELSPSLRNNFDYIFTFKDITHNGQKKLYDRYFNNIASYSLFRNIFVYYTLSQYSFIVNDTLHGKTYYGILDDLENITNYRCPLKKVFWEFDQIITRKYQEHLKTIETSPTLITPKTRKRKIDEYPEGYLEDNIVKRIRLSPELEKIEKSEKTEKYKPIKLEFKKPKYYPSSSPTIPDLEEIVIDKLDIYPSLD